MAATKQHYVVMLRANGSACGCMGPYATVEAAKQEAVALPRANPGQTECVVVRANGFRDAMRVAQGNQMPDTFVPVRANRGVEPLPARLPRSTVVQTLLFDSSLFNVGQAKSWAKRHGFRFGKVDTGGGRASFIRLRQVDPAEIAEGSFRTIRMTDGIEAVIGMPKRGAKRNPSGAGVRTITRRGASAVAKQSETVVSADGLRRATVSNRKRRLGGGTFDIVRSWVLKERDSGGKLRTVFSDATLEAAERFIGFTFPPYLRLNPSGTELLAATIAPELVAAKAAAGLAARGVTAAGKGAASVVTGAGSALADIMAPRKNRKRKAR